MHADVSRPLFKGKTLQFVEQKMAAAIWRAGGVPIPLLNLHDDAYVEASVEGLDGLVLQGGVDVAPENYGQRPLRQEWSGDPVQDAYELTLLKEIVARKIPALGICRGAQIMNVALGGTLYQDLETQVDGALSHRSWERYELIEHTVSLTQGSLLTELYGPADLLVNTIHHQGVHAVAPGFRVSAVAPDGVVEGIERVDDGHWLVGIQWHPEWLDGSAQGGPHRSDGAPLFNALIERVRERRASPSS
jgi:putative glutamine amidotransferase